MTSFFFIFRITLAWAIANTVLAITIGQTILSDRDSGGSLLLLVLGAMAFAAVNAFSHVRRVRLLTGEVSSATLSSRQRRQIEVPFEAGETFDIIDAAIRDLPGAEQVDSARDSLQVRAKIRYLHPYRGGWLSRMTGHPGPSGNQVIVTVTPNGDAGSVTLICEPERWAWTDWFMVDAGANVENADAIGRAVARRVAERRRSEQAAAAQTATEKELTVAKLSLLHAQVEPHFLYNTLASAQLLTRSDPARADEMLGNLIAYLRNSLPRTDDALSTLGKELERARAYLDILVIRMGPRLRLQVEVAAGLHAAPFPAMMLQTLVENAIKHGLEAKAGGGTVWIIARVHDGALALTVADDGRGLSGEGGGTGIGLRNVRERLRLAYGSAAGFTIVSNYPSGVAATISVPYTGAATTQAAA
ncbi:sensor histidine kinase [Massilia sp. CCM 8734]|uniref:sensor histidine kinase n=1 Tax=Massilia sp. CCM 8734 TaxID=2609283 RepID=UPI00141E839F|nr:histidine kinase [Massilia sp. CCM 8734]NHZ98617.1 sensor histidine kinase [Massilia sp. CCM 8734]